MMGTPPVYNLSEWTKEKGRHIVPSPFLAPGSGQIASLAGPSPMPETTLFRIVEENRYFGN